MPQLASPMEILKLLDKSNCKKCKEATCLAFAAAVFRGDRQLDECPKLAPEVIERFGGKTGAKRAASEQDMNEAVKRLQKKITTIDLSAAARRLEADFSNDKLTIKVCGKNFSVDSKGNLSSEIHVHPWISVPVLNYVLYGAGKPVTGNWVTFRELKNGKTWDNFFRQRCEKPLKRVADTYTNLFEDMLEIFNGKQVENHYASDISLVLHPLPKLPILICYWKPEEELDSDLNIFFDSTAEDNLRIESIFTLGTGLARMFEKIALTHGV